MLILIVLGKPQESNILRQKGTNEIVIPNIYESSIMEYLSVIENEARRIGNYSGAYDHKLKILENVTELKSIIAQAKAIKEWSEE